MSELAGKAVILTGASRGIGAAAARDLAARGAAVLLVARSGKEIQALANEIQSAGGTAQAMTTDVAYYGDMTAAVARCIETFGGLDVLINNAGLIEPISRLAESDPAEWERVADVNYKGVYFAMRAALPEMLVRGGGLIVNVSSGAATAPLEGWSHYCSAKAGALMLTRMAHLEYASRGIHVIGLAPGTVMTHMQVAIKASGLNPISQIDPSAHKPPEVAGKAISWLCTAAARQFDGSDVSLNDSEIRALVDRF